MNYNEYRAVRQAWGLGDIYYGHIKIKNVRCGAVCCYTCPHKYYAYFRYKVDGKSVDKYLGRCYENGMPYEKVGNRKYAR